MLYYAHTYKHIQKHSHSDGSAKMCAIKMSFHNWTFLHSTHMNVKKNQKTKSPLFVRIRIKSHKDQEMYIGFSAYSSYLPSNACTVRFERNRNGCCKNTFLRILVYSLKMKDREKETDSTERMKTRRVKMHIKMCAQKRIVSSR